MRTGRGDTLVHVTPVACLTGTTVLPMSYWPWRVGQDTTGRRQFPPQALLPTIHSLTWPRTSPAQARVASRACIIKQLT